MALFKDEPVVIPKDLPERVDWRNRIVLTVRFQKNCKSCWAVGAISVLESSWQIKNPGKPFKTLSPQMLLDCVELNPAQQFQHKQGWYPLRVVDEPYEVYAEKVQSEDLPTAQVKISGYETIRNELRERILRRVFEHPVAAVIDVYPELINVGNRIYEGIAMFDPKGAPHAVVIVGYDGPTAKNYWTILSSWGPNWGAGGFGRVSRDHKLDGRYLLRKISYPVL